MEEKEDLLLNQQRDRIKREARDRGDPPPKKDELPKRSKNDPVQARRDRVKTIKMNAVLAVIGSPVIALSSQDFYVQNGNIDWPACVRVSFNIHSILGQSLILSQAGDWANKTFPSLPEQYHKLEGVIWAAIIFCIARCQTSNLSPDDQYKEYTEILSMLLTQADNLGQELTKAGKMPLLSYKEQQRETLKVRTPLLQYSPTHRIACRGRR